MARERSSREHSTLLQQTAPPGTTIVSGGASRRTGRHLAFVARDEQQPGRTALWIRAVDASSRAMFPETDGASKPFFSPDGQTIAFFANGRLVAADVTGTHMRTIASVQRGACRRKLGRRRHHRVCRVDDRLVRGCGTVARCRRLTRLDHTALDVAHAWPQFLPDGRRFLYQVVSPDSTRAGVYVASLDASGSTRLLDYATAATYVAPGLPAVPAARHADGRAVRRRSPAPRRARCAAGARRAPRHRWPMGSVSQPRATCWRFARGRGAAVDVGRPIGAAARRAATCPPRCSTSGSRLMAAPCLRPVRSPTPPACGSSISHSSDRRNWPPTASPPCGLLTARGVAFTSRAGLDLHVRSSGGIGHAERAHRATSR